MAYIDELLGRGERILYVGRQHTFVLISSILTELGLIAVLIAAGVASPAVTELISFILPRCGPSAPGPADA